MEIKDTAYFCVQKWMVTKLNLRTVERDVFAIIYGYSQDGDSDFHGSLSYLAELTGYSKNSICTALKNLTDKQLIIKDEKDINNIKFCYYTSNLDTIQALCTGIQALCTNNNINNNTESNNTVSKDTVNVSADQKFEFGKPKPQVRTNKSEYDKAIEMVNAYSDNKQLVAQLVKFVDTKKEIAGRNRYKFYSKTIENYLDALTKECDNNTERIEAVKLSIRYNGTTQIMKPNKTNYSVKQNVEMIQENDYDKYSHKKANREF